MPSSSPSRRRERLYWLAGVTVVVLTWATLKWARVVSNGLRDQGLLTATMAAIFVLAAALVVGFVVRQRPRAAELAVLAAFGVVYLAAILPLMGRPEEALHFVQYGLVGGLFYCALAERRRPAVAALGAFLLTVAAGWIDEGIQHLLPERVYDLRDVGFNAAAGALAIAAVATRRRVRARARLAHQLD
ncbi:MAG TPA: VanZ family protein [Thermoanaerobaculia bacterium]|nr:VanZ family protein [Thermoanaerobaculia bacterium]